MNQNELIKGKDLMSVLKYVNQNEIEMDDYELECYESSIPNQCYFIFIDHCGEDSEHPNFPLYDHIHIFAVEDENVIMHFNGYWINLKNLLTSADFIAWICNDSIDVGEKADLFLNLIKNICSCYVREEDLKIDGTKTEIAYRYLEQYSNLDINDNYVFIGDKFRFLIPFDHPFYISNTRKILERHIRLNFDIESDDDEMRDYLEEYTADKLAKYNGFLVRHSIKNKKEEAEKMLSEHFKSTLN